MLTLLVQSAVKRLGSIVLMLMAALQATLHPAQTDALYFVARGDDSSHFSGTLEQHNRAVNRYQK